MEKFKKILPTIIFNIAETGVIVLIGMLLDVPITYIILIIVTFLVTRGLLGKTIHFKTWYRCMVWSLLLMLSLFELFKVDLVICITFAVFTAYILTGKAKKNGILLDDVNFVEPLLNYRYDRVMTYPDETVGDFVERCAYGTYLITMPNHITTVIDGVVYDTFDCRDRILWDVWKVE